MGARSQEARVLESPSVRIKWLAGPRAVTLGAGWCVLGLLLIGALVRLASIFLDQGGFLLVVPLAFLALLLLLMAFFCAGSGLILWLVSMPSPRRQGSLWIEDGLCVEAGVQRAVIPLVTLTGARLYPERGLLALKTRDGDVIEAGVGTADAAARVLDAIATGTVHRTWSASLYPSANQPWWNASPPLAGVALTALTTAIALAFAAPDAALSLGVLVGVSGMAWSSLRKAAAAQDCVVAGSDGISIRRGTEERFIAFTRIAAASETIFGLALILKSGEAVELTLIPEGAWRSAGMDLGMDLVQKRRSHLLERIQAEIAPRDPDAIRVAALLERKGRSVRDWRASLAELVSEASRGYRRAMLTRDQAQQVLDDGKAPAELRIGAALALAPGADQGTVAKLRVAVDTCVNPAVRVALTQATYGVLDDDTLAKALQSAEAEAEVEAARESAPTPPRAML